MSTRTLVILAAGRARRFGSLKPLAPVGVNGEAVIDMIASDAMVAGFTRFVVVVNPDTGPTIQEHIAQWWPRGLEVSFAVQEQALGTVSAVLSARDHLRGVESFAVSNADDLYGAEAFARLRASLGTSGPEHCVAGFELGSAVYGELPVSRGVCVINDGELVEIVERHQVQRQEDGSFIAQDGLIPDRLTEDTPVSMNLWGFRTSLLDAMEESFLAHDFERNGELQLSTFVGSLLGSGLETFCVVPANSTCLGVTHAQDLATVKELLLGQVRSGERPAEVFVR